MLEVVNLKTFTDSLDRWIEKQEQMVEEVARGLAAEAFHRVVEESPQYSGDFAANWKYSINTIDTSFTPMDFPGKNGDGTPYIAGDNPAVMWAVAQNKWADNGFKLGDTVYISNSAYHDEPYALKIEDGSIRFRPGNRGSPVEHTLQAIQAQYGFITSLQAQKLRKKRL